MNIYFGINFFYMPPEHRDMIESFKSELFKNTTYRFGGEILIPVNGKFHQMTWYGPHDQWVFLEKADVLIVDTTHTPSIHPDFRQILSGNQVKLIECCNKRYITSRYSALLYEDSIFNVFDEISKLIDS